MIDQGLVKILGDLVGHLDGATAEEDADEVFCGGCYRALATAREWLDVNDPTWIERRVIKMPKRRGK